MSWRATARPTAKGELAIERGIEVGHVFYLGTKYSKAMNATFLGEDGKPALFEMGCYGIGITRLPAAAIEQNHDERGIIWPDAIAPFTVVLCPITPERFPEVKAQAEQLYAQLQSAGVDVILDDRGERPGAMFADWELIGVPHRVTIGDRALKEGQVEYQHRRDAPPPRWPRPISWPMSWAVWPHDPGPFASFLPCFAAAGPAAWLASPGLAHAGGQLEEPLMDSVRTALSSAIANRAPPEPVFASTEARLHYLRWLGTMSDRLRRRKPDWEVRRDFLQTVWYESGACGAGCLPGPGPDPGRECLPQVRGLQRGRGATCRSCRSGPV
jgi:hypothetical protein